MAPAPNVPKGTNSIQTTCVSATQAKIKTTAPNTPTATNTETSSKNGTMSVKEFVFAAMKGSTSIQTRNVSLCQSDALRPAKREFAWNAANNTFLTSKDAACQWPIL